MVIGVVLLKFDGWLLYPNKKIEGEALYIVGARNGER